MLKYLRNQRLPICEAWSLCSSHFTATALRSSETSKRANVVLCCNHISVTSPHKHLMCNVAINMYFTNVKAYGAEINLSFGVICLIYTAYINCSF